MTSGMAMITSMLVWGTWVSTVSAQDIPDACGTRSCSEALFMAEQFVLQLTYAEVMRDGQAYERGRWAEGGDPSVNFYAAHCTAKRIQEPSQWRPSLPAESWMVLDVSRTLPSYELPVDGGSQTDPSR